MALAGVQAQMRRLGMSRSDLARVTDLDLGTIGDFLNGHRWPRPATRVAISQALGWGPWDFAGYGIDGPPTEAEGPAAPSLHTASDSELLAEIARRFSRPSLQAEETPTHVALAHPQPVVADLPAAARTAASRGRAEQRALDDSVTAPDPDGPEFGA